MIDVDTSSDESEEERDTNIEREEGIQLSITERKGQYGSGEDKEDEDRDIPMAMARQQSESRGRTEKTDNKWATRKRREHLLQILWHLGAHKRRMLDGKEGRQEGEETAKNEDDTGRITEV